MGGLHGLLREAEADAEPFVVFAELGGAYDPSGKASYGEGKDGIWRHGGPIYDAVNSQTAMCWREMRLTWSQGNHLVENGRALGLDARNYSGFSVHSSVFTHPEELDIWSMDFAMLTQISDQVRPHHMGCLLRDLRHADFILREELSPHAMLVEGEGVGRCYESCR